MVHSESFQMGDSQIVNFWLLLPENSTIFDKYL